MRALFAVALLASLAVVQGTTSPAWPWNGNSFDNGGDDMCQLDTLQLTNGLSISNFSPDKFEYTCACSDWSKVPKSGANSPGLKLHMAHDGSHAQVWFNDHEIRTEDHNGVVMNPLSGDAEVSPLAQDGWEWIADATNTIKVMVNCGPEEGMEGQGLCEYVYLIHCRRPPDQGPSVSGDPQFVGLRGQQYQVHGVDGEIYSIVSDSDLQYNSRFVFLSEGQCPKINGHKAKNCWSHPGSYLGELGLKTRAGDKIRIVSGSAADGFANVEINGRELEMGETVMLADDLGSVSRNGTHVTSVQVGNWDFVFENSDLFINQRVRVIDMRGLRSHGLLGQTWRETTYPTALKHIQGSVDDYAIREQDIFGDNFVFNAFN